MCFYQVGTLKKKGRTAFRKWFHLKTYYFCDNPDTYMKICFNMILKLYLFYSTEIWTLSMQQFESKLIFFSSLGVWLSGWGAQPLTFSQWHWSEVKSNYIRAFSRAQHIVQKEKHLIRKSVSGFSSCL